MQSTIPSLGGQWAFHTGKQGMLTGKRETAAAKRREELWRSHSLGETLHGSPSRCPP